MAAAWSSPLWWGQVAGWDSTAHVGPCNAQSLKQYTHSKSLLRVLLQVETRTLTIKHTSETEAGTINFENTAGPASALTARKWTIQPRSFDKDSAVVAGYDALMITSDTSPDDNNQHRQVTQ